jgi:hypothetical protein
VNPRLLLVVLATLAASCESQRSPAQAAHASLGGDTIARVGDVSIPVSLVAAVAAAQKVPASGALGLLIDDALAAAGARAAGLNQSAEFQLAETAARARLVVLHVREEARSAGPPTDAEVNLLSERHWLELDLPEQMRVIHAVVMKPKKPELQADAAALAAALAATEAAATSADDFEVRANALSHGADLEIKVERLDPFVADGRIASPEGGGLDPDFVRGALPLAPGTTSGVVRSAFGWHVIRMIERMPEHRVPFEQRRRLFEEEVQTVRARRALDKLDGELAHKYGVTVSNGVEELMTDGAMMLFGVERAPEAPLP